MTLDEYEARFPSIAPQRAHANTDELRHLSAEDSVRVLGDPPAEADERHVPQSSGDLGCHLWVFYSRSVPYVLETAAVTPRLQTGRVKHTNLTAVHYCIKQSLLSQLFAFLNKDHH